MSSERHERIRQRAHAIWEREGRPHGLHEQHWYRATSEIDAEDLAGSPQPATASAAAEKKPRAPRAKAVAAEKVPPKPRARKNA
ncbi:DUF2934 domain-containing protein [Mesorhizobium sp. ASY16-5R]|uniref:DUF2934 domain-containing protein n=1 Tax=Mesorhizobium sp. ASY16-5R TaxID=3445772 RepID=UPI003FA0C631